MQKIASTANAIKEALRDGMRVTDYIQVYEIRVAQRGEVILLDHLRDKIWAHMDMERVLRLPIFQQHGVYATAK